MLQWGHAVIGVDTMTGWPGPHGPGGALQWGHAVIGVDTIIRRKSPPQLKSFNGATP